MTAEARAAARPDAPAVVALQDVTKVYRMGRVDVPALRAVTLQIARGEYVAIMGPSGSGKSTLMNLIGCLDRPTSGSYLLDGQDVSRMTDDQFADVRNRRIGFVFQTFNLLARMSALRNVELPLLYGGVPRAERRRRAFAALEQVGLAGRVAHTPQELSGGEQQRVAIARALVGTPAILLADEPTGNLDSHAGDEILAIFQELNGGGITLAMVTHDGRVAEHARRILSLRDGLLVSDELVAQPIIARRPLAG
ncbi:MAG TPA: ABC transporter ATP-binding protein [bacterium]|jgi:putative ABC transport system ATP-binding protein|nr:ABC transporter ATP-binding protein [bacterium]